jgi:hypothetical protein
MFNILYGLWLLLPLGLALMGVWAIVKPYLGVRGAEDIVGYFKQAVFCFVALAIAIGIDQTEWFEETITAYSFDWFNISIARWLLYPGVLLAMANVQRVWNKEDKKRELPRKFIFN